MHLLFNNIVTIYQDLFNGGTDTTTISETNSDWHCRRLFHLLPFLWLLLKWSSLRTFSYVILMLLPLSNAASCYLIMCYCWIDCKFLDRFNVTLSSSFPILNMHTLCLLKCPTHYFLQVYSNFQALRLEVWVVNGLL